MNFREYLKERTSDDPVLPLRGHVKGNTIEKNTVSAQEFFGGGMGAVIMRDRFKESRVVLVYTSGDGKSMYKDYVKKSNAYQDYPETTLAHDQTGRFIGDFDVIGYVNIKDDGSISKIEGAKGSDKIAAAYTYK